MLTHFDPQLRGLLSHPALAAVIVPSRTEPFGRIPLEAFAAGAAPVVATTAGGLAELVIDGLTGYTAQSRHPASLAAAISRALACDSAGRARLRVASRRLAVTRYDHAQAVAAFCAEVAPWTVTTGK
jgi:glycosyltransferase involved in cell wall biosynthesis